MALEKATITHILTSSPHHLELVPGDNDFVCYRCTETGTGHRYHCKNCGDLSLHQGYGARTVVHALRLVAAAGKMGLACEECSKIGTGRHRCGECGDFLLHRGCPASEVEEEEAANFSESARDQMSMEREPRVYIDLTKYIYSPGNSNALDLRCVGASSTYEPGKGIENTLLNSEGEAAWWSNGSTDPSVHECLIFRLPSDFCIVDEIRLEAGRGSDISYSAKSIRFKMGYPKSSDVSSTTDEHYTWHYTSPMFSMIQEDVLQSLKLPSPVFCIGGVVKI